jgi:AcrR family transcriptional regulator
MKNASITKLERRQPNQLRARLTKQKILAAAHKILIRDGVRGLTTRSLAKEAGLSIGIPAQGPDVVAPGS